MKEEIEFEVQSPEDDGIDHELWKKRHFYGGKLPGEVEEDIRNNLTNLQRKPSESTENMILGGASIFNPDEDSFISWEQIMITWMNTRQNSQTQSQQDQEASLWMFNAELSGFNN